ncbi:MAG: hypothetical protein LBI86_00025, partial [Treponema sp.]|nr:hypothetical protein [Treponema sp.]
AGRTPSCRIAARRARWTNGGSRAKIEDRRKAMPEIKPLTSLRFIFAALVFLAHYSTGGGG